LILAHQLPYCGIVAGDVTHFEIDSSLREEGLSNTARRSTWLAEHNHLVFLHIYLILTILEWSLKIVSGTTGVLLVIGDYRSAAPYGLVP
jgi:hypothetical protein